MFTSLLFFAATGAADPPVVGLISADDFPQAAMDAGEQGTAGIELLISPNGRVDRCMIIVSTGYSELDTYTCDIVEKRARFSPATTADGTPAYGIYRQVINWNLGSARPPRQLGPDLELDINQVPPGVRLPLQIKRSFLTKTDGSILDCKLNEKSAAAPAELAKLACKALGEVPPEIIRNSKGEPVDAFNSATVLFKVGTISRSTGPSPASP